MTLKETEDKLIKRIEDSHLHPDDNDLQQALMMDCFQYFVSLPDSDKHLFCKKERATILVYLLLVLTSFNAEEIMVEVLKRARESLNSCKRCVFGFHVTRALLREKFLVKRKISYQNVEIIMQRLASWESDYLENKIRTSIDTPGDLSSTITNTLVESMLWPRLLRQNKDLKNYFDHSFALMGSVDENTFQSVLRFYPGIIYCLFEGTNQERTWALSKLPYDSKPGVTYTASDFYALVMEEYEVHFYRIQDSDYYSDDRAVTFWCSLDPILRFCDADVITQRLQLPVTASAYKDYVSFNVFPLTQVFINQSLSYLSKPLPFLLRTLAIFLEKIGYPFFKMIKPHSYLTFFDIAFQNPVYLQLLTALPQTADKVPQKVLDSSSTPLFGDLFRWMTVCYPLLKDSQKAQFSCIVFNFMMDRIKEPKYGEFFGFFALNNVSSQLKPKKNVGDSKLTFELINNSKVRSLVDKRCIMVFDAVRNPALRTPALHLISAALQYDVVSLAQNSHALSLGDFSVTPQWHSNLWNLLQTKFTVSDTEIVTTVIGSLAKVVLVHSIDILYLKTRFESSKEFQDENLRKLISTCSKHNKNVSQWINSVEKILSRVVEYSTTDNMQHFVKDDVASMGIWSCILSPEEKVYQSGISFLYEAFDVDARYEAFRAALKLDTTAVVKPFSDTLLLFEKLKIFKASKRGVRILMDFIKALFDPIHGLLALHPANLQMRTREYLVNFWEASWRFLRMIYVTIFPWSSTYERIKSKMKKSDQAYKISQELLEFTRDALDLSKSVLNSYKMLVSTISFEGIDEAQVKDIRESLFHPVLGALKDVMMWLRLSDPALLVLCVNLIVDILDLSMELGLTITDENITSLTKLCAKAKKYNNKLNEEQTGKLLLRARKVNAKLVEDVLSSVEEQKRERAAKNRPSIRHIGTISSGPVVPKRLSVLEQARIRLSQKRKMAAFNQPAREPAPARPSGFNRKHDSSSESEDDDDDESSALFTKEQVIAKMRKSKATLSSINRQNPALAMANRKAAMRETINKKKKEEELMRLRLNVDMSSFYHHVLSWSYEQSGDYPTDGSIKGYSAIIDSFPDAASYQKTFGPLLLLECWQGIQRAKQVGGEKPFKLTVASRSATDTFYDVYAAVDKSLYTEERLFKESDLLVLMYLDKSLPSGKTIHRHHLKARKCSCFAKVHSVKISNGRYADLTLRISTNTKMVSHLTPSSEVVGMRVMQMTTVEREYSSLKGLPYYNLADSIVKAIPSPPEKLEPSKVLAIKKAYSVNDSQAVAIAGTVHKDGFALIQGPPGTGKTKTILGIIGYFLTSSMVPIHGGHLIQVPESRTEHQSAKRHILVCAPSNAAVDELVVRLMKGIKDSNSNTFKPKVVRLGRTDAINEQVRSITLEELVDTQLSSVERVDDSAIREEHKKCIKERDELRAQLDSGNLSEAEIEKAEVRLQNVVHKRRELGKKLDEIREERSVSYRNREIERRNIQFKILNEAQVVCSTLSGSAHDVLAGMSLTYDTVVIDEAAQCTELSAIIPLRYGCTKCVMVGDPNQLPPTVLSQKAASYKYEQSLFVRMQNNYKDCVYLLNTQYRMHPAISSFPSKEFYHSRLLDGPNMAQSNSKPWHKLYGPYMFFDIRGEEEQNQATKSLFNYTECSVALELLENLFNQFPEINWAGLVGVISPYKEQVKLLRKMFIGHFGQIITKQIDFNTVDGFQGQEKEVILFSCVRAENHTGIGFLADIRRMNVALTRARSSLWILGSKKALTNNKTWRDLINDAYNRHLVTSAYRGFTENDSSKADKPRITEIDHKENGKAVPINHGKVFKPSHSEKSSSPHSLKEHKRSHGYLSASHGSSHPAKRARHGVLPAGPGKSNTNHLEAHHKSYGSVSSTAGMFKLSRSRPKYPSHLSGRHESR